MRPTSKAPDRLATGTGAQIASLGQATDANHSEEDTEAHVDEVAVEGHFWPLIPDGEYSAQLIHYETALTFGTPKVYLHFRLIDPGEHLGVHVFRAYRVKALIGRPRRDGGFSLSKRSDLFLRLCALYESSWHEVSAQRMRPDRISLRPLKNVVLKVSVRTVVADYQQRPLPHRVRYSVVGDILGIEAGALGNL